MHYLISFILSDIKEPKEFIDFDEILADEKVLPIERFDSIFQSLSHDFNNVKKLRSFKVPKKTEDILGTLLNLKNFKEPLIIDARKIESAGTIKFYYLLSTILVALKRGATLCIDEFDSSVHSSLVMNLINVFHDDYINKNKAQLIATSHNQTFMSPRFFRRDEIFLLDHDGENEHELYSLSDFDDVTKNDNYIEEYFSNIYGATRNIDLNTEIEDILENNSFFK